MSRGPEGKFKSAVDEKLPLDIHHQPMTGMFNNGTPDRYYENKKHLWVEYKWIAARRPHNTFIPIELCRPLQQRWLRRAARNRQPVWVVVAGPGWVYVAPPGIWDLPGTHEGNEGNAAKVALMIEDACRGRLVL